MVVSAQNKGHPVRLSLDSQLISLLSICNINFEPVIPKYRNWTHQIKTVQGTLKIKYRFLIPTLGDSDLVHDEELENLLKVPGCKHHCFVPCPPQLHTPYNQVFPLNSLRQYMTGLATKM